MFYQVCSVLTMCLSMQSCWIRHVAALNEVECGFPGTPANGNINITKDSYNTGEQVSFFCDEGYERQGPPVNTCNNEGLWRNELPLCLQNLAFKRSASQTSTENDFVASLAVDGNKLTCAETKFNNRTYNNMWSVQLDQEYPVERIELKAQLANSFAQFNLSIEVLKSRDANHFQRCQNISPSKGISTYEDSIRCGSDYKNITGSVIRIVDLRLSRGRLKLCEVKVFTKEKYKCGKPDLQPNCEVKYFEKNGLQHAEYHPKKHYQLIKGSKLRVCNNGKWSSNAPLCVEEGRSITEITGNKSRITDDSNSSKDKKDTMIIGIAIGVTAASISTVIVIVVIVIIMRKLYRKAPNQTGTLSTEHEGVFFQGNNSSCGSRSPTIHATYSDPWDDPNTHMYDYINPETIKSDKLHREPSQKSSKPSVDGTGYITSRRPHNLDIDKTATESLLDPPIPLRPRIPQRRQYPGPIVLSPPQIDNRTNSFNEIEVDAYDYSESEDQSRM